MPNIKTLIRGIVDMYDTDIDIEYDEVTEYDHDENIIYFALKGNADLDPCFLRHLRESHNCKFGEDIDIRLWALMHEIGHHFTLDNIDLDDEDIVRYMLGNYTTEEIKADPALQNLYYDLPSEFKATEWAIRHIRRRLSFFRKVTAEMR